MAFASKLDVSLIVEDLRKCLDNDNSYEEYACKSEMISDVVLESAGCSLAIDELESQEAFRGVMVECGLIGVISGDGSLDVRDMVEIMCLVEWDHWRCFCDDVNAREYGGLIIRPKRVDSLDFCLENPVMTVGDSGSVYMRNDYLAITIHNHPRNDDDGGLLNANDKKELGEIHNRYTPSGADYNLSGLDENALNYVVCMYGIFIYRSTSCDVTDEQALALFNHKHRIPGPGLLNLCDGIIYTSFYSWEQIENFRSTLTCGSELFGPKGKYIGYGNVFGENSIYFDEKDFIIDPHANFYASFAHPLHALYLFPGEI
jgi:hypothetical protein